MQPFGLTLIPTRQTTPQPLYVPPSTDGDSIHVHTANRARFKIRHYEHSVSWFLTYPDTEVPALSTLIRTASATSGGT